ncbi:RDD family protein [Pseudolysinimonas yzui]|uniref:RDD family protein n=1 Tax=Pseudolysinimonas yzui TaxID=2708254 RepID=A0A8J3LYY7_9MICO|nr:RDD family protein [Pseudolysinimonas yzui]
MRDPRLDAVSTPVDQRWPGERLGLPESGPRSIARPARRIAALAIDWALASVISLVFFSTGPWQTNGFVTLGLFAGIQLLFLLLLNGGVGHLLLGMRVVPLDPGRLAPWRALVRTLLVCLFVPAVIWDADQRGLHDRAAGTLLVRV